jgi:3-hydroxyisobutyrate dehydrogenase-like beta-hydroxyacid dehydrogenase
MGISLAASALNSGHAAYWVSQGRSPDTYRRAKKYNLVETGTVEELCQICAVIISVCPPHAAALVAGQVLACSFEGIYADVNAISPEQVKAIGRSMSEAGVEFVDGGIIGGPAWTAQETFLYLSGRSANRVADCFVNGPLETELLGDEIGKASALKMCYAARTKGTTALLCAIVAAAEQMGVRSELEKQWSLEDPDFTGDTLNRIRRATAKAWRFSGEMEEIASTFKAAGLPDGFHLAASQVYQRITKFKGADPLPPVEDVLEALLTPEEQGA